MYTVLVVLIVILAVLMCLIVLIQESKGGGLASSFSASNQIMGVRKTTDVIEKMTWGLAAAMVALSVVSVFFIPKMTAEESTMMKAATEQRAVNSNNLPGFGASQPQQAAPAQGASAPAASQPAAPAASQEDPDAAHTLNLKQKYDAMGVAIRAGLLTATPEIEEQLSNAAGRPVVLSFTPHLVPMNRGILVTAYASLKETDQGLPSEEQLRDVYERYYGKERFIRFLEKGVCPETRWVEGSNYVDVNIAVDARTKRVIMMGAMDNLVKGAAGQAVQNMNLLFGLPEEQGLVMPPLFP